MVVAENFGEFGESEAIHQNFYPSKFTFKNWIVDYGKVHWAKMHTMSILKYFHPVGEKPDLPDPSGH